MALVLYYLYVRSFQEPGFIGALAPFLIYIVIAFTDFLDGIIARKYDIVTELGKELDPMADKVLVFLMLFAFYRISLLPLWSFCLFLPEISLLMNSGSDLRSMKLHLKPPILLKLKQPYK
jgi:phosphatidylglycerophosphate synthase